MSAEPRSTPTPEFSRRIEIAGITVAPAEFRIAANQHERAALAARLGLLALAEFSAIVTLRRVPGRLYELSARLTARVTQECVVTLDPFETVISDDFVLVYGAAEDVNDLTDDDKDDIEPLTEGIIDIGEAVAQQLSLVLDPYPHGPGAALATGEA
jgi:uncharacterized metal-binding protein YceD (DUF177 family)